VRTSYVGERDDSTTACRGQAHNHGMEEAGRNVELNRATVPCGEQIAGSITLTINELATSS
jgi:hypothetical protein